MQKSDNSQVAKTVHRQTMASTTLNRKYVDRPVKKIAQVQTVKQHPVQVVANQKLRQRQQQLIASKQQVARPTAKELKDQAIKKALASVERSEKDESKLAKTITEKKPKKIRFGAGRIVLALFSAAVAVLLIVVFVSVNMPDVQFRATALQLDATYPNYLPRDYSPTEISSEGNLVRLSFENNTNDGRFSITEEKSSWDSNSLLNNYILSEFGEDYTVIKEQGLTIYIGNDRAAWVNGGVVYKLKIGSGSLTKKQITSIAVSF